MKKLLVIAAMCCTVGLMGQVRNDDVYEATECRGEETRYEIRIPNVGEYLVLKSDLHTHSVFSDGGVWPSMLVREAWHDGLDVMAITDHIEYRPHADLIKADFNESFKIAKKAAAPYNILVIPGSEITRKKPLGHMNALFVTDANLLKVDNELEAIDAALAQGAYIQWNHPGWPDDKSTFYPVHEELIKAGKIHAVELVNSNEYYPLVFDWFQQYNLAPTANTDLHSTTALKYRGRRPMTLILSKDKSLEAVREALFARRTLAYYADLLMGSPELLRSLVKACIAIDRGANGSYIVRNLSDLNFKATLGGKLIVLNANQSQLLGKLTDPEAVVEFQNCYIGHNRKLTMSAADWE